MTTYRETILKMYNDRKSYDTEKGTQHPRQAKELVDGSPIKAGDWVLDVATGTGLVAFAAAKYIGKEGKIVAFDLADGLLEQARKKLAAAPEANIEFQHGDAMTASFPRESFDLIYCCEAMVLFEDPFAVLARWQGFLKPTGAIAFTCTQEDSYFGMLLKESCRSILGPDCPPQMHELLGTKERIESVLVSSGFTNIRINSEPGGGFMPLDKVLCTRSFLSTMFKGAPAITALTNEQFGHVCELFQAMVANTKSLEGVWQNRSLYFVHADKAEPI